MHDQPDRPPLARHLAAFKAAADAGRDDESLDHAVAAVRAAAAVMPADLAARLHAVAAGQLMVLVGQVYDAALADTGQLPTGPRS